MLMLELKYWSCGKHSTSTQTPLNVDGLKLLNHCTSTSDHSNAKGANTATRVDALTTWNKARNQTTPRHALLPSTCRTMTSCWWLDDVIRGWCCVRIRDKLRNAPHKPRQTISVEIYEKNWEIGFFIRKTLWRVFHATHTDDSRCSSVTRWVTVQRRKSACRNYFSANHCQRWTFDASRFDEIKTRLMSLQGFVHSVKISIKRLVTRV